MLLAPFLYNLVAKRDRGLFKYYLFQVTFALFVMYVLKMVYRNPRPYWVSNKIEAWHCESDFGNPSGHSLGSMAQAVTLGLSFAGT